MTNQSVVPGSDETGDDEESDLVTESHHETILYTVKIYFQPRLTAIMSFTSFYTQK
jgi:hypothetical protein